MHVRDRALLESVQKYFGGVGTITKIGGSYTEKYSMVHYEVSSVKHLTEVIIAHFDKYPLITQKRGDFELFKQVVGMLARKEHLTPEGIQQVVNIRASINHGLSAVQKSAFPNSVPVLRPIVEPVKNIDLY